MNKPPFEPTTCACRLDQSNCKIQPGHLLPGQIRTIMEHLGKTMADAAKYFWNSPGMVLGNSVTKQKLRIRTITPRFEKGSCIFFKDGLCQIHAVAPFGCRYFDVHMNNAEAQKRGIWGAWEIMLNEKRYAAERDPLPLATHYKPKES